MNLNVTKLAIIKIKKIYSNSDKNLKFRIYISGGGCNGFIYNFILDAFNLLDDIFLIKTPVIIITDYISFNYLKNSTLDYKSELMESNFYIYNPNAKSKCNCGKSFGI